MQEFRPTVLVVEDEPGVRSLIVTILRLSGFDALHCADTVEAQDLMAVHGNYIQLLVTDVNLGPEEDGVSLGRGLQDQYPHLRVLYISGLVDEGPVAAEVAAGRAHYIPKPFTPRSLTDKVTSILDARFRMAPGDPVF
jgi:two-component system, cell cycle sensor histidine kinase and response regulator CckA